MRRVIGYIFLFFSCFAWCLIPVVPFFDLSLPLSAGVITSLLLFGEITWWLSVFLLGKELVFFMGLIIKKIKNISLFYFRKVFLKLIKENNKIN